MATAATRGGTPRGRASRQGGATTPPRRGSGGGGGNAPRGRHTPGREAQRSSVGSVGVQRSPARSATPPRPGVGAATGGSANDVEIREFLEGLLEGFRAAAAANAAQGETGQRRPNWFDTNGQGHKGTWRDLDDLEKTLPEFKSGVDNYYWEAQEKLTPSTSPAPSASRAAPERGAASTPRGKANSKTDFSSDPLSTMMRRHALRSFLEETNGSVARAFEQMASVAMAKSVTTSGGPGQPEQRMKYKFAPQEFQKALSGLGYGVGAGADWWRALFKSCDVDEDGLVSLQDMYDALVLDLPPIDQAQPHAVAGGAVARSASPAYRDLSPAAARSAQAGLSRAEYPGMLPRDMRSTGLNSPRWGGAGRDLGFVDPSLFETLDTNRDGHLSSAEFREARSRGLVADVCTVCGTPFSSPQTLFCSFCGKRRVAL